MPFGLTIGTERATALQNSIQDELTKREYSADADPVMAEYITIMIINNKTGAQITSELEDLIGSDFDQTFTDWLFAEAAKGAPDTEPPSQPTPVEQLPSRDVPPQVPNDAPRRPPNAPRTGAPLYQQALSQAIPSTSPSAQKRTASARSPSPNGHGPNKLRRMDLPTGPRAMQRDGHAGGAGSSRSLLERVGGPAPGRNVNGGNFQRDDIQARIDNITNGSPDPNMMMAGFPPNGMGGMDMGAMAMAQPNPLMLQEMMMSQMAMMAQMASSMGMVNPANGQFTGGFPMQQGGMPGDMGMFNGGAMNGFPGGPQPHIGGPGRGRGVARGRGSGRGRATTPHVNGVATNEATAAPTTSVIAPTPTLATPANPTPATAAVTPSAQRSGYVPPERPQSPTLCKFGMKCTNALCRWSHPSPVATTESGVVLTNEACENGRNCKDKDCIKSHVSPAVNLPPSEQHNSNGIQSSPAVTPHVPNTIACRFGAACTRPGCTYSHPPRPSQGNHFAQQCRFGAGCTRATCPFQHPEGRVLPTTFHRGLSTTSPVVSVQTPEAGSMGAPSQHRSVKFNNTKGAVEDKLAKLEAKKAEAEKAVAEAEAAVSKKDETKSVAITA